MRRLPFVFLILSFAACGAWAQTTVVSGTVSDTNSIPYAGAQLRATLVLAGAGVTGQPVVTVNNQQQCISAGQGNAPCKVAFPGTVGPVTIGSTGIFTLSLQDNSLITPAGTQWQFDITTTGAPPPLGTGPQKCTTTQTISGAAQALTINSCPAQSAGLGTSTTASFISSLPQSSHLLGAYLMVPGENPAALIDYSGRGNNSIGTAGAGGSPSIGGAPGGGLGCNFTNTYAVLPTALNVSRTIVVGTTAFLIGGPNQFEIVSGNGGGPNGHYVGLVYSNTVYGTPSGGNAGYAIASFSSNTGAGGTARTYSIASPMNTYVVAGMILSDPNASNLDSLWEDGVLTANVSGGASNGFQDRGNYQLCGSHGGTSYFGGILPALFWDTNLSGAEMQQVAILTRAFVTQRGLNINCAAVNSACPAGQNGVNTGDGVDVLHMDGDSVLQPIPGTAMFFNASPLGLNITSSSGFSQPLYAITQNIQREILGHFNPNAARNTEIFEGGYDDAQVINNIIGRTQVIAAAVHAQNGKAIPVTMLSHTNASGDSDKNTFNLNLMAGLGTQFDGIAYPAAWANLGADGAFANATIFPDGVHPSTAVGINEYAPSLQAAYNHIWGNTSYTKGTTDTSAAAAPTATTAGSESTNTVTTTFGATPANCLAGNLITFTGITPGGYNGTFQLITRTGTQVTTFNGTTGLGPITVQGTGVCPSQVDADVYKTLNFGAGNWNLQPCELWVGTAPQFYPHIRNTNAVASTLVAFSGETINGAATLTLPGNSSVTLSPNLVSPSASGCTWTTQ